MRPLRRVDEREVAAGKPGAGAAEEHRQEAHLDDAVAERVRGDVVVADGAEHQPGAAAEEEEPDGDRQRDGDVGDRVEAEDELADDRQVGKAGDVDVAEADARLADIGLADQAGEAEPEERQRQAGRDLVGDEDQRHHARRATAMIAPATIAASTPSAG